LKKAKQQRHKPSQSDVLVIRVDADEGTIVTLDGDYTIIQQEYTPVTGMIVQIQLTLTELANVKKLEESEFDMNNAKILDSGGCGVTNMNGKALLWL
jgi:hypothetical protein